MVAVQVQEKKYIYTFIAFAQLHILNGGFTSTLFPFKAL